MAEALVWTLIGCFLAAMLVCCGVVLRIVQAQFEPLNLRIELLEALLTVRIEDLETRLGERGGPVDDDLWRRFDEGLGEV